MTYDDACAAISAGDFVGAEEMLRDLIAEDPDRPAPHYELGRVLGIVGRWSAAAEALERCIALAPQHPRARFTYAMAQFAVGDFTRGWPYWDSRLGFSEFHAPQLSLPLWQGEPLNGKTILVMREQGHGDQIQAARFVRTLLELGARVMCETMPGLVRLFDQVGATFSSTAGSSVQIARPDVYTHYLSLPRWLGTTLETVPSAPYFRATARKSAGRIGIAVRGDPNHPWDRYRSLPPADARRLLSLPGTIDLDPANTGAVDFLDTAEIIAGLDHVVTVDTAVAHLAGALGKPVSILIPALGQDWRWMEGRADSPWYPTARLYRQKQKEAWADVLDQVAGDIWA